MPIEILMPALSPTMKEGNVAKWIKKEGDQIKAGEVLAEIETDKATMEVEAVDEGILGKILIGAGTENVAVNSCIALIIEPGEDNNALEDYIAKIKPENSFSKTVNSVAPAKDEAKDKAKDKDKKEEKKAVILPAEQQDQSFITSSSYIKASPLAKRIARNENISLAQISGSGPGGRVIKDDVLEFLSNNKNNEAGSGKVRRNPQEFYSLKNNNIRKIIAKRLLESKQSIPHFYLCSELNINKLLDLRSALNEAAETDVNGSLSYKISVNDLVIKATAMALKKVPRANSFWSEEEILIYNNIDISVAVAIENGLITPIIRNADQKTLPAISNETRQLVKKAREGKLQPEEFQGGSFSISNLGMFGIDNFAAIINPPQSCILAVSRAVEKPVVEHGQIKIAHMMNVTLSSDHRSVDGAIGAEFLKALRSYIEQPILMLI
jgi:pyruvate dehydrogenase E2 component (dihydrolipoamide acetyltransferase)